MPLDNARRKGQRPTFGSGVRELVGRPLFALLTRVLLSFARVEHWRGIRLAILAYTPADYECFRARILAALELIARYSPRDVERMRQYTSGIFVHEWADFSGFVGKYTPSLRLCQINASVLRPEGDATRIAVGLLVVHELTHARLDALGLSPACPTEVRTIREETVCIRAQIQFARRLPQSAMVQAAERTLEQQRVQVATWYSDAAIRASRARARGAVRQMLAERMPWR